MVSDNWKNCDYRKLVFITIIIVTGLSIYEQLIGGLSLRSEVMSFSLEVFVEERTSHAKTVRTGSAGNN